MGKGCPLGTWLRPTGPTAFAFFACRENSSIYREAEVNRAPATQISKDTGRLRREGPDARGQAD